MVTTMPSCAACSLDDRDCSLTAVLGESAQVVSGLPLGAAFQAVGIALDLEIRR